MAFALTNARVLVDGELVDGLTVCVEGERIVSVARAVPTDIAVQDLGGAVLAPGFIDVQVNGGGDALFNDDPSVATIRRIGAAHAAYGTTGFLPTLISDDLHVIRAGIAAVEDAIAQRVPGVLGIHIEGPFINRERKGIHDGGKIRAIDAEGVAILTSLRTGGTLVTLAPELAGPDVVRRLVAAGVVVAAGHTAGSFEEVTSAIDAGLTGATHLFNAMSQLGNREPGAVGAALLDERTWCSLIVDGHHVHPATLRLALRCKPAERFVLVTDAMPPTGGAERSFLLGGRRISSSGGRLVDEGGTLAGADLDMAMAVRNARSMLGVSLPTALGMASTAPATFMGLADQLGRIAPTFRASMVALTDDGAVIASWIDGGPAHVTAR